jgi:hypothetical protein
MNGGLALLFDREVLKSIFLSFHGRPVRDNLALNVLDAGMKRLDGHWPSSASPYRTFAIPESGITWTEYFRLVTIRLMTARSDLPQDLKRLAYRLAKASEMMQEAHDSIHRLAAKAETT